MSHVWSIAQKEFRGYFRSAVALIFLGIFLGVTVFTFFWVEGFFSRGLTDVRPMFEWFPILLIFLVSALTMRLWSEEKKTGTIEILLTLPIPPHKLVLGKFLAGFMLIAVALALTLPIPITVSMMGNLDWGPVVGGYVGALMLASAYLAIGLCVSSMTDNQLLALFGTGLVCGAFYLVGADALVDGRSIAVAEVLRQLGTGSRFESVARGVLDFRDLAYYGGLTVFFVALNSLLLRAQRWSHGRETAKQRLAAQLGVGLIFANVVGLSLWLAPIHSARVDITEDGLYSLSPVTKDLVSSLDEPLLIRGYFSKNIYPDIDVLIPSIRDLLEEYAEASDGRVHVEFVDPDSDEDIAKEAREQYGIEPDTFPVKGRNQKGIVNAYAQILVEYGDQHEVVPYPKFIRIVPVATGVEIDLGNIEYELTKAIKKTVYGFNSLEAMYASLGGPVSLKAFVSEGLGKNMEEGMATIEKVAKEMSEESGGQLTFTKQEPKNIEEKRELLTTYGLEPFQSLVQTNEGMQLQQFYYHLLMQVGERAVVINPPKDLTDSSIRQTLEAALKQLMPGFVKTVGLVTPPAPPSNPQMQMQMRQPPPRPPQSFEILNRELSETYRVRPVSLATGKVDQDIDILILAGPEALGTTEQKAIDQFLMGGGAVVVLAGSHRLNLQSRDLSVSPVSSGLKELLATYGVEIGDKMVFDEQTEMFVKMNSQQQRLEPGEAPFVLRVDRKGLGEHLATSALPGVVLHYASPVSFLKQEAKDGEDGPSEVQTAVLARSSKNAWLAGPGDVHPTGEAYRRPSEVAEDQAGPFPLAVALSGTFMSHFVPKEGEAEKKDSAKEAEAKEADEDKAKDESAKDKERLLTRSSDDARLVVIGSSSFVADTPMSLSQQLEQAGGSQLSRQNIHLLLGLLDWAVQDTDLLTIRAHGAESRLLELEEDSYERWEYINYGLALALILGVLGITALRRRTLVPMELAPRGSRAKDSGAAQ